MTDTAVSKPSVAAWKKAKLHEVVLPSSYKVTIKIPDLSSMIETGQLPQTLLDTAVKAAKGEITAEQEQTPEMAAKEREFKELVCVAALVEPKITVADVGDLPVEDLDMIVEFACRQREFDAEGNHLSGLHLSEQFRRFRRIAELYEDVEGLQGSE